MQPAFLREFKGFIMKREKNLKKMKARLFSKGPKQIATVMLLAVVVLAALSFGFSQQRHQELIPLEGAALLSGSPHVNVTVNLSIDSLSYLDQKTQFYWSGLNDSFPGEKIVNNSDFVVNASGYQIFQNNKSSSAQASPSYADFTMGPYLGTNITYLYSDSRIALNGSTTFYEVLSENNFAAVPTSSGNSSTIWFEATYSSGAYTVTYNYFDSSGFHSGTFSKTIKPLQFYQFFILVQNQSTVLSIEQGGATIDTVSLGAVNLSSMLSASATGGSLYSEYMSEAGASTTNTSMILNFGYLVDHNTFDISQNVSSPYLQVQGPADSVISGTLSSLEPFDPGTANATFLGASNKTDNYGQNNVNQSDFKNVTAADSNISIASAGLNKSLAITGNISKNNTINATQAFTTLAITNETNSSVSASLQLYSWNSTYVSQAIHTFMQDYTSGLIASKGYNVNPNEITVANYVITQMSFDQHYGNNTANAIRAEIDNAYAADLASNNLTLVNTTTNAIVAGAFAGDFLFQGMAIHPIVQGNEIMDPVTGQAFQSLEAAGFAAGSYLSEGAVIVPSLELVNGNPGVFTTYGFSLSSLNPFSYGQSSLTAAGSAVSSFFHQATSVPNALSKQITAIGDPYLIKPITTTASTAYQKLSSDVSHTVSQAVPFIGGTVNTVKTSFGSGLQTVKGDLGQAGSAAAGALVTGANDIKSTAYNVGDSIANSAGQAVNTSHAVLSSLYTKGLSAENSLISSGVKALDTVGGAASNAWSKVTGAVISAGGAISKGASSAFSWISSIGATIGHVLEYVGIGIVVVVVAVLVLMLLKNREEEGSSQLESSREL